MKTFTSFDVSWADDPVDPLELPVWNIDLGFELLLSWSCGCELKGFSHRPMSIKKGCPLHGAPLQQTLIAIDNEQDVRTDNPGYSHYPIRNWPKGTFARRSPQAMRRLEIHWGRLSAAVDRRRGYSEEELSEFIRQIEVLADLVRSITTPKLRRNVLPITKSA